MKFAVCIAVRVAVCLAMCVAGFSAVYTLVGLLSVVGCETTYQAN